MAAWAEPQLGGKTKRERLLVSEEKKGQSIHDMANYIFGEAVKRANADNFDEAVGVYNNILDLAHAIPIAYSQRGRCHWEMRRWFQAKQDFEESLRLDPTNDDYAWSLGLINLQMNKFKEGWDGYERRWGSKVFKSPRLSTHKPQWKLGMDAKKVLVWCEQGLGDQIIYSSLLNELNSHVEEVTVMIDARLVGPLSRAMPKIKFLYHDAKVKMDEHDAHIPIASLGSYFINSLSDIPAKVARNYMQADPKRVNKMKRELGIKDGDLVIGLSWASTANAIGKHKSCALTDLEPILKWGKANGFKFLSLQYGLPQEEMAAYPEIMYLKDVDMFFDIDGVCAGIQLCDRIVSVSNVNVHMAGAMGKPVYLLDANKLWYWYNKIGQNNLWYPSVKIYPRDNMLAPWDRQIQNIIKDWDDKSDPKTPTIVFFHVGDNIYQPQKLVSSIRASNPHAKIIMCTDIYTPHILGVDRRHEAPADRSRLMISRLAGFATLALEEPAIYLDTDMLVLEQLDPVAILGDKDAVFCRREFGRDWEISVEINGISMPEYKGKTLDQVYPFVACASVTQNAQPWVKMLELLTFLDPKFQIWYGDQEAIKLYATMNPERVAGMGEAVYGCLPEHINPAQPPKIVHFKGTDRKKLFEAA
jgi:hypothetical protein